MAYSTHTMPAATSMPARPRAAAQGVGRLLKSWWEAYWMRRAQRVTVAMLRSLDDRRLHDVGIDRSEIESVVYGRPGDRRQRYEATWR